MDKLNRDPLEPFIQWNLPSDLGPAPSLMALRTLTEQVIPDALFVHDHSGRFIEINDMACESLGYSREELLNLNVTDIDRDFDLRAAQVLWQKLAEGERRSIETRHWRKDGSVFPVRVHFGLLNYYSTRLYIGIARKLDATL